MELKDKVIEIIINVLGIDKEKVKIETKIVDDLGADELDSIEIIMELEGEYGITIPDEDAEKLATVGDLVTYIESKINKESGKD